jgi:hypothetical protein
VTASDDGGTACEGRNVSQPQTFVIDIGPTPDAPVANSQSVNAFSGAATPITLTGSDIDGDALTFRIVSNPTHGTATTDAAGHAVYTSTAGYAGPDSFTFVANDGTSDSAPATVSITVVRRSQPVCVAAVVPPTCVLSYNNDGKKYILSLNGDDACILLDGSGSSNPGGGALTISWTIDGTNHLAGTTVPVCLPVGCHSVEMVATDGGGTCRQSMDICVITTGEAIEQIVSLIENTTVDRKNKRPLIATLKAAAASYDRDGHNHTAANQLNAFQNKVRAQIGRTNPAEAQKLIDAVNALTAAVGCAEAVEAAQQGN